MLHLARRVVAESVGTGLLLATVVGSGIMAQRLAAPNVALILLANAIATGAVLVAIIETFVGVSGAHFNPSVTVAEAARGGLPWREVPAYVAGQIFGGVAGVGAANVMFGLPLFAVSHHARGGAALLFSEFVATFGLLMVILGCSRFRPTFLPVAVGAYITAGYWFTASTSFANPAVTIARSLSDTFTGIRPLDVPPFVLAQLLGAIAATALSVWLVPSIRYESHGS